MVKIQCFSTCTFDTSKKRYAIGCLTIFGKGGVLFSSLHVIYSPF
jgi:hypothetical protein